MSVPGRKRPGKEMAMLFRGFFPIYLLLLLAMQLILVPEGCADPTSVTGDQGLNFGMVVGGSGHAGTITISASGVRSFSGSIVPLGSAFAPAQFTITGNAGKTYTVTLPASFTVTSGEDQMAVSALTSSIPLTGAIPAGGVLPFSVGGTLSINSIQKNSVYSGSLSVTVK